MASLWDDDGRKAAAELVISNWEANADVVPVLTATSRTALVAAIAHAIGEAFENGYGVGMDAVSYGRDS